MTVAIDPIVPALDAPARYTSWTPIIVGALVATALSSILLAFGATIGLGVTSAAPTWRDASAALAILSGLYLIIQAVVSFGVGGYIAGRTRTASVASHVSEIEHRDGLHGLAAWAVAVVLGTLLAAFVGSAALTRSNASLPAAGPVLPSRFSALNLTGSFGPPVALPSLILRLSVRKPAASY